MLMPTSPQATEKTYVCEKKQQFAFEQQQGYTRITCEI